MSQTICSLAKNGQMNFRQLLVTAVIGLFCQPLAQAQLTINGTIVHDTIDRDFILYVPSSYNPSVPAPLVFNFHGYTSNAFDQMWYGDFRAIAETAGFLIVHPQGTLDGTGTTHFNVGWGGSTTDDVGFTDALIDSIAADYNIDLDRIYSTGMSNGGFMSFLLACELSDRFAAVASVTGSIAPAKLVACNPQHPTPIMQIHGDNDGTVPYTGGFGWSESISNVVSYWTGYNNCTAAPIVTNVPDINVTDGSTVEHYLYEDGDNCVEVEHYKIINGDHTWPGSSIIFPGTNYDINASEKIWEFFSKYDINGEIGCVIGINETIHEQSNFEMYPNPTSSKVHLNFGYSGTKTIRICNAMGSLVSVSSTNKDNLIISSEGWGSGFYFVKVTDEQQVTVVKKLHVIEGK